LDFRFNPFNDNLLATCSEDCHVKVTQIPDGGVTESIRNSLVDLAGHGKKVIGLEWNPTANNILATAGFDKTLKVWDVETQGMALDIKGAHTDTLYHLAWNRNGSQIATTSKDKKFRLFDPRQDGEIASAQAFQGSKKIQCGLHFGPQLTLYHRLHQIQYASDQALRSS
jgi:coronin-2